VNGLTKRPSAQRLWRAPQAAATNGLAAALVVVSISSPATWSIQGQQARDRPAAPARTSGSASMVGQVVDARSGSPLRRAQIRASLLTSGESWAAETDVNGRYRLVGLPAGRYNISAIRDGYIGLQHGQRWPGDLPKPLLLADHQTLDRVDYRLPRSGVIAGRVIDEFGDPRGGVMVVALESRLANGRRVTVPAGRSSVTSDLGEFRISGLNPGGYYLSARPGEVGPIMADSRSGYAPTYYPGTLRAAEAQQLVVELSDELTGITLALAPGRTFQVRGSLRSARGMPLLRPTFTLASPNALLPAANSGVQMGNDGTFTLLDVAPGDYLLFARASTAGSRTGGEEEFASVSISVTDADIAGLDLITTKGTTIKGRVRTDRDQPLSFDASRLLVVSSPSGQDVGLGRLNTSPVSREGTFELSGVFGERVFTLQGLPASWQLKSVLLRSKDVVDMSSEFRGAEEVVDLSFVVTDRVTELTGTMVDVEGRSIEEGTVLVFADEREKWMMPSRYVRLERTGRDGQFAARGLPPGLYLAIAVGYLKPDDAQNPQFLESVRQEATLVSLGEGEKKSIRLTLSGRP
jgi:carboxypeptidase family protein